MKPVAGPWMFAMLVSGLAAGNARAQIFQDPSAPPSTGTPAPAAPAGGAPAGGAAQGAGSGAAAQPTGPRIYGMPQPQQQEGASVPTPNGNVRIQVVGPEGDKSKSAEPEGMYLGRNVHTEKRAAERASGERAVGPVPEVHVVKRGDTLWDICAFYFSDPWRWPEIWAYNPGITNPHWIYPGDQVRLFGPGQGGGAAAAPDQAKPVAPAADRTVRTVPASNTVELRQLAFVSIGDLRVAGTVTGSTQEKQMLSEGDDIYIDYPSGQPPQVGGRYSIYAPTKEIVDPQGSHEKLGAYVVIRGEVQIQDVKKGKTARGKIVYVTQQGVVERGDRVGTLKTQFRAVAPVAPTKNLEGFVVGLFGSDSIIGEGQIVLVDRGKADALVAGNTMSVVRRGDAFFTKPTTATPAGMNDRRYPDAYVADIIVVDVGDRLSVGLMTRSAKEIFVGDRVLMRTAR
jgi:LysM domain-containing protein